MAHSFRSARPGTMSQALTYAGSPAKAGRDRSENRLILASLIAFGFLILVPLAFHFAVTGEFDIFFLRVEDTPIAVMLMVIHAVASVRLALLSVAPNPPVLRFTFWVFVYVWIANVPALQFTIWSLPWRYTLPVESYRQGLLVVMAGLAMYELGAFLGSRRAPAPPPEREVTMPSATRLTLLLVVSWASVGLIAYYLGAEAVFGSRELRTELSGSEAQAQLIVSAIFRSPILVAFFAMLALLATGAHKRIPYFMIIFAVTAVLCLVANFPTAVSRAWLGSAVLGALAVVAISWRKNLYAHAGVPLIAALLLVFPLLHQFRRDTRIDFSMAQGTEPFVSGDFDVMQMHSTILDYAQYYGLEWGRQLAGPFLFWIPRSSWPDKPIGTGMFVAERTGMPFTNVSAPLWAEAYINFGIAGVCIGFAAYGWLSRRYELRLATRKLDLRTTAIVAFLSGFQIFLLRGDLLSSATYAAPFAVIAALALKPAGRARRALKLAGR